MPEITESERLTRVESQVSQLASNVTQLSADVRLIIERIGTAGKPNWPVLIGSAGVLLTIVVSSISAFYFLTTLQTQSIVSALVSTRISPLESRAEVSIRDREEIRLQLERVQAQLNLVDARDQSNTAKMDEGLIEVESQFRSADQMRNIQFANNMRWTALLWRKSYGEEFPSYEYYPSIAQPPK